MYTKFLRLDAFKFKNILFHGSLVYFSQIGYEVLYFIKQVFIEYSSEGLKTNKIISFLNEFYIN